MTDWRLPVDRPVLGVVVRVGPRGPVVPAATSDLFADSLQQPHGDARALGLLDAGLLAEPTPPGWGLALDGGAPALPRLPQAPASYDADGLPVFPWAVPVTAVPLLAYRLSRPPGDLFIRLSTADLAQVSRGLTHVRLHATLYHPDGTREVTLDVDQSSSAPNGVATAVLARNGSYYLLANITGAPATMTVTYPDGLHAVFSLAGQGLAAIPAPGEHRAPVRVTLTTATGIESRNILARVLRLDDPDASSTPIAPWPFPPYLSPAEPNLAAYLAGFEAALDVRPDHAGDALNLTLAQGEQLDDLAQWFGAERRFGESDADLSTRALFSLAPRKASIAGLTSALEAAGIFGVRIVDAISQFVTHPRRLDGSWKLDGSVNLGGPGEGIVIHYGEIAAIVESMPQGGVAAIVRVLRRYVAAGILIRVIVRAQNALAPSPGAGLRARRTIRFTLGLKMTAGINAPDHPALRLDGSWPLDGTQNLDASRNE